jgi:hypothetical protein
MDSNEKEAMSRRTFRRHCGERIAAALLAEYLGAVLDLLK